ncbi:MAG TPA: sigma-54 dependent transcriptional regulator [Polyangiaceae bacterium]|nr:sigma-54 dependent transcriptional regulator [Polyangiaceae bacterium]
MQGNDSHTLLVADAEQTAAQQLERAFGQGSTSVEHCATLSELLRALEERDADAVFLAESLAIGQPDFVRMVVQRFPDVPVVLMVTAGASVDGRWVSAGAADFVRVPIDREEVLFTLQKLRCLANVANPEEAPLFTGSSQIVVQSEAMREVFGLVDRVAAGISTVMIRGESGTGKEVVARRIHEQSPRAAGPFIKVHCAALPEQILESEVFGYERGAFTGASARKPGRVELAEGGTLFLDEIGDISSLVQVKLLRLLQDREYERLGGTKTLKADVRFISATHRNLEKMVQRREFREDLYYRLNVVRITLPALRNRREEVAPMVRHFCALAAAANQRMRLIEEDALALFEAAPWRGNVRQLQNFVERLVVLSDQARITRADVARELAREEGSLVEETTNDLSVIELDAAVRVAERRALERALKKAAGNRVLAARLLGVSRRTLFYKLRVHDIS